jgi:putative DNA primase/helicase
MGVQAANSTASCDTQQVIILAPDLDRRDVLRRAVEHHRLGDTIVVHPATVARTHHVKGVPVVVADDGRVDVAKVVEDARHSGASSTSIIPLEKLLADPRVALARPEPVEAKPARAPSRNGRGPHVQESRRLAEEARRNRARDDLDREPDAVTADAGGDPTCLASGPNEAVDDPHRLARAYLAERRSHADGPTLRYHRGDWFTWDGAAYAPLPDTDVRADVAATVKTIFDEANRTEVEGWQREGCSGPMPVARKVGTKLVADVMQALASQVIVGSRLDGPAWIGSEQPWPAADTLAFCNDLVHLPSLLREQLRTTEPTPGFFSCYAMPFAFDPDAPEPTAWFRFLDQLWADDPASIDALGEWFGYCMTSDTSQQKILGLIGPPRSGKGTVARILTELVGRENTRGPTLASFATNFGLADLIGKPLAIISDARLSGKCDQAIIIERLLSISGEDSLTLDRKYREPWTGKLPTRLMLLSNELPRLTDASRALSSRMTLLRLTTSFLGREDTGLMDKLIPELPGILVWALAGLRRLRERGRFVQPKSGGELVQAMEDLASPITAFVHETCEIAAGAEVAIRDLYRRWVLWCEEAGRPPGSEQVFGRDLQAAFPAVGTRRPRVDGVQIRSYVGIRPHLPDHACTRTPL